MNYLILLLASIITLSYSNGQTIKSIISPTDEETSGVKSKVFYSSLESKQIMSIEDFEYNANGLLIKKIYYGGDRETIYHYELFFYNNNGTLNYKLNYYSNIKSPTGYILMDSTNYSYSVNLLTTENINYPLANYYDKYSYEYDGKHLIKKTIDHNKNFESSITYECQDGKILKERNCSKDRCITSTKEYKYKDSALVEIVCYTSSHEAQRRIEYSYNESGKLSVEKVDELLIYSSARPYVVKYLY
jgi:hypothetical protein